MFTSLIYPDLKNFAIMNLMLSSFTIFHFYIFLKVTFKKITTCIVFNKWCLNKDINENCFITKFNMRSNKITITLLFCFLFILFTVKNIRNLTFRRNSKTYSVDNMFEWYYAWFYSRSIVKQDDSKQLHVVL